MSCDVRKLDCCICENKDTDSCAVTAQLIGAFVFATWIVQSLFFLNLKFQVPSYLLWLYSPVCVRPGRKPRRPVFSRLGSYKKWCLFPLTSMHLQRSFLAKLFPIFSSPEPSGSQGELIVYPWSGVRRPSVVRSHFQTSSPLKPLDQSKPNFMWSLLGMEERKFI